ncbi:MAG: triose-phosphate isomerase [Candidatus Paceibacterota bacterium]
MKKTLVVANWKMNPPTVEEAYMLFDTIKESVKKIKKVEVVIAPPLAFLGEITAHYRGKSVAFSAQDVHWEEGGSFTGSHAPSMAKSLGATYSIVGHSERRKGGETNEDVNKKIKALLKAKMTPILCIGEKERDAHAEYLTFLKDEIKEGLGGVEAKEIKKVIIAYEPLWAIGKDHTKAVRPRDLHEIVILIRKFLTEGYDLKTAHAVKILYGGSAEAGNAGVLVGEGEIDGLLVGHASLNAKEFSALLREVEMEK